jgi:hypothetical protein
MLARLLTFAMLSGVVAVFGALWLGLPVWMLVLAYSLAGSVALLFGGALVSLSTSMPAAKISFERVQPEPVPVRVRR